MSFNLLIFGKASVYWAKQPLKKVKEYAVERINFNGKATRKVAGGLLLLATIMLTACNGSSEDGNSTTTPTPTPVPGTASAVAAKMEVLISSPNLASDGNTPVVVSARVKDANNVLLEGQTVVFSTTDSAQISVNAGGITDKTGTATANVTTGNDQSSRNIKITATVQTLPSSASVAQSATVSVSGTKITLNGTMSLVVSKESALTINLKDAAGKGIANQLVALESALKNTFKLQGGAAASSVTTDSTGQATVKYVANNPGNDVVKASSLGESVTLNVAISNNTFSFTPSSASQAGVDFNKVPAEVNIGSAITLDLLYSINGSPQANKDILFNATRGDVSPINVKTDSNGKARVVTTSTTAGPVQITASATGISNSYDVEFVAITPDNIVVQADSAVVRSGAKTGINATVRDVSGNLVKNQLVTFKLTDPTGGSLSIGSGTTNSSGQTSTNYTAGNSTSAKDGVTITASIPAANKSAETKLTVGGKALFVRLGTGNKIEEANTTQNLMPYSIIVTDAAGSPVAGALLTLTIIPNQYLKGQYETADCDADGKPDCWAQKSPITTCASEDLNSNGILDKTPIDEDVNKNGRLEPGNVASVYDALDPSKNTVKTDATGSAFIKVLYGKNFATWAKVMLRASTIVEGSEYGDQVFVILPGLAKDYTDLKIPPPGETSPFGIASVCTNPN